MVSTVLHAPCGAERRRFTEHPVPRGARSLRAILREWQRRARSRRELLALDARTLRDIGVTRAEAVRLGTKPFWKE